MHESFPSSWCPIPSRPAPKRRRRKSPSWEQEALRKTPQGQPRDRQVCLYLYSNCLCLTERSSPTWIGALFSRTKLPSETL